MTTPLEEIPSQSLPDSAKLIIGNSYIFQLAQFELDRRSGSFRAAGSDSQLVTITGDLGCWNPNISDATYLFVAFVSASDRLSRKSASEG